QSADEGEPNTDGGTPPVPLRHRFSRQTRDLWQVVGLRLVEQEKERVQRAHFARLLAFRHAIELRLRLSAGLQFSEAMTGTLLQLLNVTELDRCRRAGLGAGRGHVVFDAVVAKRALVRRPRLELSMFGGAVDDPEGAGRYAETTAIADVLLDVHRVELGPDQCPRRPGLEAGRSGAVLSDLRHHQPALILPARIGLGLFDELDVTPGGGPQRPGVVVTVARHGKAVTGELISRAC